MLLIACVCLLAISGHVLGQCSSGCKEPTLLYDDLKCKPVFASPDDCCPSEYDCSHIEQRGKENEEICYFHGETYRPGKRVKNDDTYGNCRVGCYCRKKDSGNMGFTCAILDCPEWLGVRPTPGCHFKHEVDKCCGGDEVCPPFTATCKVGNNTYKEGQRFYDPEDKCMKCVCKDGFAGKFEAPFCKKRACIEEVNRHKEVYHFCAPSYIHMDDCCPFNWVCPANDVIVSAKMPSDVKCKFGHKTLNVGDKFERTHGEKGKLTCECRIGPYLTCIQNYDYPAIVEY